MKPIDEALKNDIAALYSKHGAAQTAKLLQISYRRCKNAITASGAWKEPRNRKIRHEFHPELPKGRRFISIYMKGYGDGLIQKICREFSMAPATAMRLRNLLKLPLIHSNEHPGRKRLYRRIKKLYVWKERSTEQIARIVHLSSQRVNQILREQNVDLRPQHVTNCLYFKTRARMPHNELLKRIKTMWEEEKTIKFISRKLGIDQSAVSNKLKAMGYDIVIRKDIKAQLIVAPNLNVVGIYKGMSEPYIAIDMPGRKLIWTKETQIKNNPGGFCIWCNHFIQHLYIAHGPKKQKFCSRACKNKCKDLRRGPYRSIDRFIKLSREFHGNAAKLGLKPEIKRLVLFARHNHCKKIARMQIELFVNERAKNVVLA